MWEFNKYRFDGIIKWYEYEDILNKYKDIKFCHKDHCCDGYEECDNNYKYNKTKAYIDDIKYIFSGKFDIVDLKNDLDCVFRW